MEVKSINEQLFFVTARIETEVLMKDGKIERGVGTGFIVEYAWGEGKKGLFVVTNKHVIKNAVKGSFFFIKSDGKNPILGERYDFVIDNFEKNWFLHFNPQIDVAVMPLGPILQEIEKRNWQLFFRTISRDLVPSKQQESDIDAIEEIVFVGYPSGLFDEKKLFTNRKKRDNSNSVPC